MADDEPIIQRRDDIYLPNSQAELISIVVNYFVNKHKPYYVRNLIQPIVSRMVLALSECVGGIELACYRTEHFLAKAPGRKVTDALPAKETRRCREKNHTGRSC